MDNQQILRDILAERFLGYLRDFYMLEDVELTLEEDQHKPNGFIWRLAAELEDYV
jgi:hypothetical protein